MGSNSADYVYNEDKIRNHKDPVMNLGNGREWEAEIERNVRESGDQENSSEPPNHGFLASDNHGGSLSWP